MSSAPRPRFPAALSRAIHRGERGHVERLLAERGPALLRAQRWDGRPRTPHLVHRDAPRQRRDESLGSMRAHAIDLAEAIRVARYPHAKAFFLSGSIARGEGTAHSDLDLVVIFEHLRAAYRESFVCAGRPVEAFVHDPETLAYFFRHVDRPTAVPSLANMVLEGVELPEASALSTSLKHLARSVLDLGPPPWDREALEGSRYRITDLVDDLRDARPPAEMTAIGVALYPALANHVFRSRGLWSATGKAVPRRLRALSPTLAERFESAFAQLFATNQPTEVIALAEHVLRPQHGWLFDGYRSTAPEHWRADAGGD